MARRRLTPARPDYLTRPPERKAGLLDAGLVVPDSDHADAPETGSAAARPPAAGGASQPSARLPTAGAAGPPSAGPPIAQVSGQSAEAAALREVTHTLEVARATGRMVLDVPLTDIAAGHLTRDRVSVDDDELAALKASIRAHGQRSPAEITSLAGMGISGGHTPAGQGGGARTADGTTPDQTGRTAGVGLADSGLADSGLAGGGLADGFPAGGQRGETDPGPAWGLISGWRRLRALSELHAETGEARFATIRALVRPPEAAAESYVAMVEENEIRVGLSYYERARIVAEATARGVFQDQSAALRTLFATASRAKRSKIASFTDIHEGLGDLLRFPADIPERLGLAIVSALRHGGKARLRRALSTAAAETAADEIACLEAAVAAAPRQPAPSTPAAGMPAASTPAASMPAASMPAAGTPAAGTGVSRAKHAPGKAGSGEAIADGVAMTAHHAGRRITLTLEGDGVDAALLERALRALRGL